MNDATHNASPVAANATAVNPNGKRKMLLATVLGTFVAAALAYSAYWLMVGRYFESTDDAYVEGNVVQITPQIPGTVVAIHADDTDFVRAGQELVRLDRADAAVALRSREARLGQTVRKVRNLFANTARLKAAVAGREVNLAKARADLIRREKLAVSGAISTEEVQHARDAVRSAESALTAAREQLAANRALTGNTTVATHPSVVWAATQVRAAYLNYQRTILPAPVAGIVDMRRVQLGQHVSPGTPLMAVVPLNEVWVDANFKEGQLKDIRVGQPVRLTADANGVEYHGRVAGFGAGTGAAFALLPAQNATGNWIKVVQRLPVRIAIDPKELKAHPLAIGLSMQAEVDVHQKGGGQFAQAAGTDSTYRTSVFAQQERAVDDLIADIIARNGGGPVTTSPQLAATRPLFQASTIQVDSGDPVIDSTR